MANRPSNVQEFAPEEIRVVKTSLQLSDGQRLLGQVDIDKPAGV
jgi:hypothetical protein